MRLKKHFHLPSLKLFEDLFRQKEEIKRSELDRSVRCKKLAKLSVKILVMVELFGSENLPTQTRSVKIRQFLDGYNYRLAV